MIRFKTIDPAEAEKPAEKPQVKPVAVPVATEVPEAEADAAPGKPKGLTRKTPLRAKKPASSGLFRD
jgi:hypothetical protein